MAAVLAPGTTRIECAACEPEVVDLCNLLVKMGASIEGIGSPELTIHGVEKLHGCNHRVIADRIEAGTFIAAAAITRGDVEIKGIAPNLLGAFLDKLEAGLPMEKKADSIQVLPYNPLYVPLISSPCRIPVFPLTYKRSFAPS